MNKEQQIEEMVNVMIASNNPFVDVPIEIMPKVAKALYNAGYRKTFTSDLASDVQKAFKEGYIKGNIDGMLLARKETVEKILTAMRTMIINRRADEGSGLNCIYSEYKPERLFDDISDYVRVVLGVEVRE